MPLRRPRRRTVLSSVAALLGLGGLLLVIDGWVDFGKGAAGARLSRVQRGAQYRDGVFVNPEPLWNDIKGSFSFFLEASDYGSPDEANPVAVMPGNGQRFGLPPASGLRVTWLGHSTLL